MFARLVARMMDANSTRKKRGHGDEQSCQQHTSGLEARPFWAVVGHLRSVLTGKAVQLWMPPGHGRETDVGEHEMKQARGAVPAVPGKGPWRARACRATAGGHRPTPTARTRHCHEAANAQARQRQLDAVHERHAHKVRIARPSAGMLGCERDQSLPRTRVRRGGQMQTVSAPEPPSLAAARPGRARYMPAHTSGQRNRRTLRVSPPRVPPRAPASAATR
jgi:hypothetical protein